MSFQDEYLKLRNERQNTTGNTSGGKSSSGAAKKSSSFMDEYMKLKKKRKKKEEKEIAPVSSRVRTTTKKEDRTWFQTGAFDDGYQFGDVTKTILGSVADIGENLGSGIIGMGEKAVDALAYIAPFAENAQFYQNGSFNLETEKVHKKMVEDSKKELGKFIAKDLYDEEAVARAIISDPARKIGIDSETSVFGEKSDALIQSGGQLLATAGLSAVGLPWWVTTGATSYGSEAENALNQDANYEEAGASAAISAGAEILSEKLSGGIKFGGKALDDSLTKLLARGISNKAGRTLARLGVDMVGEGSEEVFSQIASNLGSSLYREENLDEILLSEEAFDEYLESFIGGSALGGASGGFKAIKTNRKGVDYVTELTENEQKVVDKEYKDRVAEAGEKVSQKEKSKIYDQVLNDLEKGYISTETIEEVLGGETYENYKKVSQWEDSLQEEFDTLNKMKQGDMTGEQVDRREALRNQIRNVKATSGRTQLKEQLGSEVFSLAQGSRLSESYNERTRRGQAYEADLSLYDEKQQAVIQKAVDSGILNNTNRTHEFVDMVAKISADKGVLFDFTNNAKLKDSGFAVEGKQVNGYVTKDGVTLNIDSAKAMESTVGHEITHVLEGTEFYDALKQTIFDYAKAKGDYQGRFDTLSELYKNVKDADIEKELAADLVGDYLFSDTDFINNLSTNNRNVFQKIYDEIKYLCKVATAGSKEARQLEKVKREFEKAYRESGEKQSGTKYSLTEEFSDMIDSDGEVLTIGQKNYFEKNGYKDENGNLVKLYRSADGGRTVWNGRGEGSNAEGIYLTDDVYVARAFASDGKKVGDVLEVYANTLNPLVIDAQGSNYMDIPMPENAPEWLEDSGDWEGRLNADKLPITAFANGHDAVIIKNVREGVGGEPATDVILRDSNQMKRTDNKNPTYDPDIRYSLSDSDGKQLTKEQQEYFKDSKMRDEKGNLKVMYHGSQDAGFHVFDNKFSDDDTSFFFVDRNDVAASYSGTTETYEAKTIHTAEDMNKFLAEIGYDHYEAVEKNGKIELLENNEHVATKDTAQEIYEEFCWYEGVGEGDANYKVYLNLKNPLEVDAGGRNWNKISEEFSQVVFDRYQTLTEEEKAALTDLAEWEDFGLFKSEIYKSPSGKDEVSKTLKSAYYKLLDENQDVDMYQLFDIASANFTEEAVRENATVWLKTRDYAQRAKEQGYDGVIFKNIVDNGGYSNGSEGASTVAIAFESNQIKSVANEKPSGDADIRYSLSDSNGRQLSKEQSVYFKDSKVRDENGSLKVMYHGTPNGNFTVFRDGTYFTDSKEYADRYQNPGASSISTGKVASAPKTFEVYLDIKKPFDINDAEARSIYINDYIKGGNAMGINPYLSDAEYAKINSIDWTEGEDLREFLIENEYDYDGLVLDEGGTGGYGDEVQSRGKSYVVFSPEQVKNIDNLKPSSEPDIRFSLSDTVEETKDLMALHNLTEEKLLKSLKLGGLPMPSVAIAKAKDGHNEFGEISLILPRETIDPEISSRNKLYSGDAWTPTYPKVDFKPSEKVLRNVKNKISGLVPYEVQHVLGNLMFDTDNARDYLDRYSGNMVDAYKSNDAMKYAYLKETGSDVSLPMKEEDLARFGEISNSAVRYFSGKLVNGLQTVELYQNMSARDLLQDKALTEAVADALNFDVLRTLKPGSTEYMEYERNPVFLAEEVSFRDIDRLLSACRKLFTNGVKQTVDRRAAKEQIRDAVDQTAYENWLGELFAGIVEKEGIRNNKDYFTPSGNRRSFEALHYEHNLENVIKAMREKGEKGIAFGGGSIFGAATTEFSSVDDMKQASGRLQQMSEEEYQEIKDGFTNRFFELASSLPKNKNSFTATDDAANTLTEAVAKYQTKRGIANYLRRELDGWANYSPQVVDDLIELVNDIRSMPTGYFEAKPQRAVGFEEVGVFVIPYDADVKLKQELLNRGYSIAEYDPKVEGDRQRVVNQFEEYKFSLSNVGEEPKRSGYRMTLGKDIALAPVAENATAEDSSTVRENRSVSNLEMVDFPDDGESLADLEAEEAELRGVMEAYAGVGDIEAVNKLIPEHESIKARIQEMQKPETERVGSLSDADVPPEMDAPVSMKSENYDPFRGVTLADISRSGRSYSDRNPGARHYFEEAALGFLYDVNNSTHGERWYNDELYYASGGEEGFGGTSRQTTDDIADLKDTYGYTWEDLRKAAQNVADGDFRSVAAKRVEYLLHKRMMDGYTDVDGRRYEPNQDYISFLNETFANEQRTGSFDNLLENAEQYAPMQEAAPLKKATVDTAIAPFFESKVPGTIKGQISMFPNKPASGKTANVLTTEPETAKKRSKFWSLVKEHVLDNGMVFEDLSKETGNRAIEGKWNFIRYSQSRAQRLIGNGTDGVKSLKDMKKEVEASGKTGQFYDYLYHKHNVDRMSLEDRFDNVTNKAVFGDSVTSEESQRKVDQYERMNPEFLSYAEDVYGYLNHLRGLLVENGVISQETADLWEKMYPHYVPIRRAGQDGLNINIPLDSRKTTVNNPVKMATGGNQDILPLFDTMAQRTIQTYKAIARNSFGIELKNQLGTVVGKDVETVDDVIDGIDTDDALLKPGEHGGNPTFTVFENGEKVEFEITEDMYEAMKPTSEALTYRNKILNGASSVFRGLTTQYSIPFMATNAIKDAQDVLINSQHPAKTYASFPKAWWQQATGGKWYQEYIENGGEDNTYFDNETNTFKEDNGLLKAVKFPLNAISTANGFIEMTPRLAEYIASREAGRSIEVSMLDSARVTTNFAAGGDLTKFLNSNGATFLNASVQGAIQQVRNIREAHQKGFLGYMGLAARFAVAGLPAVLLNNMLWDDDEDYEELADYVKQDYYVVAKYDDGKFIRIPKGRTVAVIQNAIEQVQNAATGEGEVDLKNFLTLAVNNLAPNNPLENNILAPVMQVSKNKTWYGEDLIPSRLQELPAAEQFDEKTDNFSKWLGETFDISPYKINYLLNQYSGGLGDLVLPMMTPRAESGDDSLLGNFTAPLRDKFTTDSVINSQVVSDFYDTKDKLTVNAKSSKATQEDYFKDLYMGSVGYELSDLYKQKREVQNSDMSDSEKYETSRDLQKQIVERMKESLGVYENVNVSGMYAEVGDRRYNKDTDSDKWYEIREKNSDGSDNYYYQKEQEVTKGLGITPEEYWNNREEYNYAYDKPEQYTLSKAVGGYQSYKGYTSELWDIKADKDENGKSINGSRKEKVIDYINNLDADYGEKIILFKNEYNADDTYNEDIIAYLNSRDDISYKEMETILKYIGFEVDSDGNISW